MDHLIVVQPDGLLALWSVALDEFLIYDVDEDVIVEYEAEVAAGLSRQATRSRLDAVFAGTPEAPPLPDLIARRESRHGKPTYAGDVLAARWMNRWRTPT